MASMIRNLFLYYFIFYDVTLFTISRRFHIICIINLKSSSLAHLNKRSYTKIGGFNGRK